MHRLVTHVLDDIPPLAFLATVDSDEVCVYHGSNVHQGDGFMCDGVWSGPLDHAPRNDDFLAGTSIQVDDRGVVAMAGNNPTDRLYVVQEGSGWVLSNSASFLCAYLDTSLDLKVLNYRSFFSSKGFGLRVGPRMIPLPGARSVRVMFDEEVRIDASGTTHFRSRPLSRPFRSFEDYEAFLDRSVRAVIANATSPKRIRAYPPIVPLSTGYDSVATAAVAAKLGVSESITMRRYAPDQDPSSKLIDHPQRIADALGLKLIEVERNLWLDRTDKPDAAIAAALGNFIGIPLLTMESHLAGRLVLVGNSGDNVWSRGNFRAYRDVVRGDTSGQGLGEWRLRADVMFVPVPYIGHTAHPSIQRIANSKAMSPWSVGGTYDRPIARRIAETAGVPRDAFGIKKFAAGALVGSNAVRLSMSDSDALRKQLSTFLTNDGVESYLAFRNRAPKVSSLRRRWQPKGSWFFHKLDALNYRVGSKLHRVGIRGLIPRSAMAHLGSRLQVPIDGGCYLPHWGVEVCKTDYPSKNTLDELSRRRREPF